MLHSLLVTLHILLCVVIVGLVLIQRGKGADAGAGFGAGASGTVFGARGSATFFSKATAVVATVFFVTSLALTYVASRPAEAPQSVIDRLPVESVPVPAPAPAPGLGGDEVPGIGAPPPAAPAE
ncbi:MAG: preprotein translocase subunit SecG [Steroidobacteraceae bacterium]|jgi:preprotein translocase subunit SecG|nr:preprotein translocase subunit SecG [Steroidobacteraceae bacterium]